MIVASLLQVSILKSHSLLFHGHKTPTERKGECCTPHFARDWKSHKGIVGKKCKSFSFISSFYLGTLSSLFCLPCFVLQLGVLPFKVILLYFSVSIYP